MASRSSSAQIFKLNSTLYLSIIFSFLTQHLIFPTLRHMHLAKMVIRS